MHIISLADILMLFHVCYFTVKFIAYLVPGMQSVSLILAHGTVLFSCLTNTNLAHAQPCRLSVCRHCSLQTHLQLSFVLRHEGFMTDSFLKKLGILVQCSG